jgi:hypothetical protein
MLGLHYRLDAADVSRLTANEEDLDDILKEFEEDDQLFETACQTDRAWEPIHNALAPEGEDDEWPARGVIGGGRSLHEDDDVWVTHSNPDEVAEIAQWLETLEDDDFRRAYANMPEELRGPEYGSEEESYALESLSDLRDFYRAAAAERSHVVFTTTE